MRLWRVLIGLWLLLAAVPSLAQSLPKFTGPVVDAANVLPPETEAELTAKLGKLKADTGRQLVVATIPDLQGRAIDDYGYQLGRSWGIGLKGVNNGAILLLAPKEHKVRIEVGYGLEPVLTDALSGIIIANDMTPRLRAGDLPGAVEAGTDAVITQLRLPDQEAKAKLDAAVKDWNTAHPAATGERSGGGFPIGLLFWGVILMFVVLPMLFGRQRRGLASRQYGSGGSNLPIVLWGIAEALGESRRGSGSGFGGGGGWSGGESSGVGGSGGGWMSDSFDGGGGGSFGGGGASGDW